MGLREIEATLPPGFRFYPSDEELICHYLYKKIANETVSKGTLVEVDLHTCEPWQLPDVAKLGASEWYFFTFRERKYSTGLRTNRATNAGYWKATGKDRAVLDSTTKAIVGMRKTLVFYCGRAPTGIKTSWVMHEFRLDMPHLPPKDWVLCRVSYKSQGGDQTPCKLSLGDDCDTTMGVISPTFASSAPPGHTMQEGYQQFISFSKSPVYQEFNTTGIIDPAALDASFVQLPQEVGDEYGFLFNMNLQD